MFATWGLASDPCPPPEVHWPVMRELLAFGAQGTQRGPPRVFVAGPLRGDDQHEAAPPGHLLHHLLQATERGFAHRALAVA